MKLIEIAEQLEAEAKRIRALEESKMLPVQAANINEARALLSAALDGEEFDITFCVSDNKTYRGREVKTTVKWSVTINYKNYSGATLAEAVNAALASLKPEPEGNVETEIAAVEAM